jgi:dynein heavy chain
LIVLDVHAKDVV